MKSQIGLKILTYISALALMSVPAVAIAASLSLVPAALDTKQTDAYTVAIVLDTQGESINAIEGTVTIANGMDTPTDILDASSIINYWVQSPTPSREIKFSGGITGGFSGDKGYLFALQFPPRDSKSLNNAVVLSKVQAFRNDGVGTPIAVTTRSFSLRSGAVAADLDEELLAIQNAALNDNIPPEPFNPQVARDDTVLGGQWFISFVTQDKQSGIDHYEIQESLSGKIDPGQWREATSPYVLQDQELHSYIFVLAQDKQGNEQVVKVSPRQPLPWFIRHRTESIVLGVLILIGLLSYLTTHVQAKRK